MGQVSTYLNFAGQCEQAFDFYKSVFGGEYESPISRFGDMPPSDEMPPMTDDDKALVLNVGLSIMDGYILMGSDVPSHMADGFTMGHSSYICLAPESRGEADRLFAALSEGGDVEMELSEMFWGDYYGAFNDKFGIQWMISTSAKA